MALTQGTNSNFPCPVYLVPNEKLHEGVIYDLCTSESMEGVYTTAGEMRTAGDREKYLKGYGFQYIKVC